MDLLDYLFRFFADWPDYFSRAGCIMSLILFVTVAVAWWMFASALPDWIAYMVGGFGLILAVFAYIRGSAVGA